LTDIQEARREIEETWASYRASDLSGGREEMADEVAALFVPVNEELDALATAVNTGEADAIDPFNGRLYETVDPLTEKIAELSALEDEIAGQNAAAAQRAYGRSRITFIVVLLLSLAASVYLARRIIAMITAPLRELTDRAARIEAGELDLPDVEIQTSDEVIPGPELQRDACDAARVRRSDPRQRPGGPRRVDRQRAGEP
jgi:methyl-accepting chemotaxis protein